MMNIIQAILKWFRGIESPVSFQHDLYEVVSCAWSGGFTVSSDFARSESGWVAMAATLGLISTREADGSYGRTWFVTQAGIGYIERYWD